MKNSNFLSSISIRRSLLGATACCIFALPATSVAQEAPQSAGGSGEQASAEHTSSGGDIIVTARKKNERLLDVPIAVSAIGGAELGRNVATSLSSIGAMIPQVSFEKVGGGGNGATFTIRGVGSASGDKGIDQTVAVNIDGVQSSRGKLSGLSFFDLQQVEVLKGPQALFFGKNSVGGVIAVRSADPGKEMAGYARAGYEFVANERYVEAAVGGPLSDTLGMRVAGRYAKTRGWVRNNAQVGPSALNPAGTFPGDRYAPGGEDLLGRVTLLWTPTDSFSANLKVFAADVKENNESVWQVKCGPGVTQPSTFGVVDPYNDCKLDGNRSAGGISPDRAAHWPGARDGQPYSRTKAISTSLTTKYDTDVIGITSVTGYYVLDSKPFDNYDGTVYAAQVGYNPENTRAVSEELRVATKFDGPLNFTVGGFFESQHRKSSGIGGFGDFTPETRPGPYFGRVNSWDRFDDAKTKTYSAFGQVSWKITDQLDLTGGARFTNEKKSLRIGNSFVNSDGPAPFLFLTEGDFINSSRSDNNVSPEVTLSWKPQHDLLVYGSYKTGFKSGGLSSASILSFGSTADNLKFKPEKVKGGEVGIKGQFLDRRLTVTASAYRYDIKNLQSTSFDAVAFLFSIKNSGGARIQGLEMDAQFQVTDALRLTGAIGYNHARYTDFTDASCYAGQTAAQGCIGGFQNLTGAQLSNAPDWAGNTGFAYDMPVSGNMYVELNGNASYRGDHWVNTTNNPLALQEAQWMLGAGIRLHEADDRWELALIGKNLTNKYYSAYSPDKPGDAIGQVLVATGRPRQVTLQGTVRF